MIIILLFSFSLTATIHTVIAQPNPAEHWSMDSLFGAQEGQPNIITSGCIRENCIAFNGNSAITTGAGKTANSNIQDTATYSLWFKATADVSGNSQRFIFTQNMINPLNPTQNYDGRGFYIQNGQINIYSRDSQHIMRPLSLGSINSNTWYYVVLVQSGTTLKGYLNGVEHDLSPTLKGSITTYTDYWSFGRITYPDWYFFTGQIDEINVYGTALSAQEIMNINQTSNPGLVSSQSTNKTTTTNTFISNSSLFIILGLIGIGIIGAISILYNYQERVKIKRPNPIQREKTENINSTRVTTNLCMNCHSRIGQSDKYCQNCGTPIIILK